MEKEVFIGWSGDLGRKIAESLAEKLLTFPFPKPWVSSLDIAGGKQWLKELEEKLAHVEYAVICLTPCTLGAPWINFEAGITYGRLQRIFVLTVGETVPPTHPFSTIQVINGRELPGVKRLLRGLLPQNTAFADTHTDREGPAWIAACTAILGDTEAYKSIGALLQSIQLATRQLESNAGIFANPLFHFVVEQSLKAICTQLNGIVGEYSVPAELYPEYLAAMQRIHKPRVLALALVEQEEFFWRGQLGKRILDTVSGRDSVRIFVLSNSRQCIDFMPTLLLHAHKYQVRILSNSTLLREQPRFCHDFSIIDTHGERLLATYVDGGPLRRNIQFSTDTAALAEHTDAFAAIHELSAPVEDRRYTEAEVIALWNSTEENISFFERKTVEMSRYISVHDYDLHEEKHAYFADMMQTMLDRIAARAANGEKLRVLEFGAGTGIFTSRLATLPCIGEIVAVEYDWQCFGVLRHRMRTHPHVQIEYQDSRVFNPPGHFDVVVSSFADHHIQPGDKPRYFQNVVKNMKENAIFLVGDEFLPPHDPANEDARQKALRAYHGHIIALAKTEGETVLATLEEAALTSGIEKRGDFKTSCDTFESALRRVPFTFEKLRIGPHDRQDVGGVFIYQATSPAQ